jgi:hypothetical protein
LLLFSRRCIQLKCVEVAKTSWVSSKKCLFKVKSFYSLACSGGIRFPRKSVWCTQASSRAVFFFAWSAALGKILTLDYLRKRRVIVINRCYMCKKTRESLDHLLHYDVAFAL